MRGDRLRKLRKEKGLTIQEVADKLGVTYSAVQGYEVERKTPSINNLEQLSILFNVSSDYLLGLSDDERIEKNPELFDFLKQQHLTWKDVKLNKEHLDMINAVLDVAIHRKNMNNEDHDKNGSTKHK
ncbi:helix-turn-helix domain-containing protein [Shouchella sp. JSM 1781072]|uniref:helix-turn-helix domain-containing protein n=1 Tax=Bacillaceae TaxID=186817 RepID=UPI0020D0C3A7|nr:helix-turn-helix transcriptional regulator [Alkalihalobacillus sp. LMS6]UTR06119.1 helix-turn-helix domain-containing protein [Alkalihalobacillus sp. LMS6]